MRVETMLESLNDSFEEFKKQLLGNGRPGMCAEQTARIESVGDRVSVLERWQAAWGGARVVLVVLGTALLSSSGGVLLAKVFGR